MARSASYILSAYSFIFTNPLDKLLDVGYQYKEGNPIPSFDEDLLIELCSDAQMIFEKEGNILEIEGDLIIVGDIHGSFHDLLRIVNFIQEKKSKVLFLGDYVDRGNFSLECITILYALKVMHPDRYFLIRGNHEFDSICSQYGFKNEILNYHNPKKPKEVKITKKVETNSLNFNFNEDESSNYDEPKDVQCDEYYANHKDRDCYKYSEKLYDSFIQSFNYLPIASIVNQTTFCIHGGLSPRLEHLEHLRSGITRPISNFEDNRLFSDVVWSDPSSSFPFLYGDNPRGKGYLFSTNALDLFLAKNALKRLIRAHQCVKNGSATHFNDKCITVFSSSSYSKEMDNNSGILQLFQMDDSIEFITFPPLKRLQKSDAAYYKVQHFNKKMKSNICFSISHPKLTSNATVRIHQSHHHMSPQKSEVNISHISNLMFITNSRRKSPFIKKPIIYHSNSVANFLNDNNNNNCTSNNAKISINNNNANSPIATAKSMMNFNEKTELY